MNILAIGDVVGLSGCEFIRKHLPSLKKLKNIDFVIANGENSAEGNGITKFSAEHLFTSGVDFITTGNHVYRRREFYEMLDSSIFITRPANYYKENPGIGYQIVDMGYTRMAILNLLGTVYLENVENPFTCADRILNELSDIKLKFVDFHAEATAEKRALAYYLDGRVTALFGTHTHVQTSDEQILPNGTGYITDLGMTGPYHSVLGVKPESAIEKMKTGMPGRFETAQGDAYLCGCIFQVDRSTGKTLEVERVMIH